MGQVLAEGTLHFRNGGWKKHIGLITVLTHPDYRPPGGVTAIWDGRLHFAGTETADQHGGYLEGALAAAERSARNLSK